MAVRSLTYLDIPAPKRQEAALKVIGRLREQLNDPLTTPEQSTLLTQRVTQIQLWADDTLPTNPEEG